MAAANKTVWGIHTMDDPLFLNQNLIAIGWEGMGNLSSIIASRDAYKEKYNAVYPDAKKGGSFKNSVGERKTETRKTQMSSRNGTHF